MTVGSQIWPIEVMGHIICMEHNNLRSSVLSPSFLQNIQGGKLSRFFQFFKPGVRLVS